MTQTMAIFYDAYRSINAGKMFWIVLILSVLVAAAFAAVGINEQGLKVLTWQLDTRPLTSEAMPPPVFYKFIFANFGIGWWLTWLATMLALISTASIFPDLINSGSIGLLVSKPISRLRLFATQYAAGLLFVTLQVALFTLASFLVIGFRGKAWEPGLFVAIPLVVCFFSYLFSVCVLLGLVTRSTLAALLLTILFWFFTFLLGWSENLLLWIRTQEKYQMTRPVAAQMDPPGRPPAAMPPPKILPPEAPSKGQSQPAADAPADAPADDEAGRPVRGGKVPRAMARALLRAVAKPSPPGQNQEAKQSPAPPGGPKPAGKSPRQSPAGPKESGRKREESRGLKLTHDILYGAKTVLPKTSETVRLLERSLYGLAELPEGALGQPPQQAKVEREVAETLRSRSILWVVGTSLGFELVVLAGAAWIFCRRDY